MITDEEVVTAFGTTLVATLLLAMLTVGTGCATYANFKTAEFSAVVGEAYSRRGACPVETVVAPTQPLGSGSEPALEVRGGAVSTSFVGFLTHLVDGVIGFFRPTPTVIVQPAPAPPAP